MEGINNPKPKREKAESPEFDKSLLSPRDQRQLEQYRKQYTNGAEMIAKSPKSIQTPEEHFLVGSSVPFMSGHPGVPLVCTVFPHEDGLIAEVNAQRKYNPIQVPGHYAGALLSRFTFVPAHENDAPEDVSKILRLQVLLGSIAKKNLVAAPPRLREIVLSAGDDEKIIQGKALHARYAFNIQKVYEELDQKYEAEKARLVEALRDEHLEHTLFQENYRKR